MAKIPVFHSPSLKIHLVTEDVGDGSRCRLRCLHGKVDTIISCVCMYSWLRGCSGYVVNGPSVMAAI